jgi:ATP-dependent exoDNAse (exonuclease V) beta subunit
MPLSISDGALPWQRLAVKNKHPRDDRISFEEETHTYTIDGSKEGWTSCTGFIHAFFEAFDPDSVIKKMMSSRNWASSKYYGMTAEEIKKMWSDSGAEASTAGTRMHLDIERYNNAEPVGNLAGDEYEPNPSAEWEYFLAYDKRFREKKGFVPYRTEWLVFKEEIKLAGSIDMIYEKPDGTLAIYDWKRAKEMRYENNYQSGKPPLDHLPDTNYWHYSLQLNIYRRILQEKYGKIVSELALVVLHPNNKSFKVIMLNFMDEEVEAMFQVRADRLARGITDMHL